MKISDTLRIRRQELGLTQEFVAREAGMHVTQYNGYERGRSSPASDTIVRLAKALQTDLETLTDHNLARPETYKNKTALLRDHKEQFQSLIANELGLAIDDVNIHIEIL